MALACAFLVAGLVWWQADRQPVDWSSTEKNILQTLWLGSLPPLPPDSTNAVADDPRAARLGRQLFFDTRLSGNGEIACATCHQPQLRFTDGLVQARAIGHSQRNTPSLIGVAYSPWFYWDGRKDSLWSQALAPLEDPAEHGGNRMRYARLIQHDPGYSEKYAALFGPLPDFSDTERFPEDAGPVTDASWNSAWRHMSATDQVLVSRVFANIGKALAAYERQIMPEASRFDAYVAAVLREEEGAAPSEEILSKDERKGLRLFIGKARCIECHNGPLFTNNEFHNNGLLPLPGMLPDLGRSGVLQQIGSDPFNCVGAYSDAAPTQCQELAHMRTGPELLGAMRTPSLRNLDGTAPYMHKGQLTTLTAVLAHYNEAPLALVGHNEAEPLGLSGRQLQQLELFLETLSAPVANSGEWQARPD